MTMPNLRIHECQCPRCHQQLDHPDKIRHHQLNLLLSHLNERNRRWVAAIVSKLFGWGGIERVSQMTGLSPDTIRRGRDELDAELQGSMDDRARRRGGGRPRRLTEEQVNRLKELLTVGAAAHGWMSDHWTLKRIGEVVRKEMGERVCSHALRRALHDQLGWTLQKPVQQLRESDDDEIQKWKTEEFARIKSEARLRHACLAFIDESGFMLAPTLRRTYAPRGHAPVLTVTDPHAKISAIAAIVVSPEYRNARFLYQLSIDYANFNGMDISNFLRSS
jgi:transposase